MYKKFFLALALVFCLVSVVAPAGAFAQTVVDSDLKDMDKTYNPNDQNVQKVNKPLKTIVQIVGGVGGTLFVLAVMYYAIMIIFGSLNPQKAASYWKALIGCAGGAFIFFGAATFADVIAGLASSGTP